MRVSKSVVEFIRVPVSRFACLDLTEGLWRDPPPNNAHARHADQLGLIGLKQRFPAAGDRQHYAAESA